MYLFCTIIIFASLSNAQNINDVPPFCKICECENDENNKFEVTCTRNVKEYLFTDANWFDKSINKTYSYKSMTVQNTPIVTLEKQFPTSDLVYLNMANNSIVNISQNIFSNLQSLETLILSYNNIELLDPDVFKGLYMTGDFMPLRALKRLHLDYNRIHSLNDDIFEHTSRIEVLTLSHNPLKVLDQHTIVAISSLVYLKDLDLSYTQLSEIQDYFLHTPKYLQMLDLSGNLFESIPTTLGRSYSLTTLFINNNPIVNLTSENGFPNVSTLTSLHMSGMPLLLNVSKGSLSNLEHLEELYMFDNPKLFHVDKAALSAKRNGADYVTWPPIKKLYLQDNQLTYLDMELVLSWQSLSKLDLTGNPWTCECENQWMIDELMPTYLALDEVKAKAMKCAAPIEMASFTFFDIYKKQSTMRCLDLYGHRPERDGILLIGILAGVLITIPLVLCIIYSYQRHWFGIFDKSPASYTRQFYRRTVSTDEYF